MRTTLQELALIEERLRGAWADLKDGIDDRHGHGARARQIERQAAQEIASVCSRLRVLVLYLRSSTALGRLAASFGPCAAGRKDVPGFAAEDP